MDQIIKGGLCSENDEKHYKNYEEKQNSVNFQLTLHSQNEQVEHGI